MIMTQTIMMAVGVGGAAAAAAVAAAVGSCATGATASMGVCMAMAMRVSMPMSMSMSMCVHVCLRLRLSLRLRCHALQHECVRCRQLLLQRHDQLHAGNCLSAHLPRKLRQVHLRLRLHLLPRGVRVQVEAVIRQAKAAPPHCQCMSCFNRMTSVSCVLVSVPMLIAVRMVR